MGASNGNAGFSSMKQAADEAFRKGSFVEAATMYTDILDKCRLTNTECNTIRGNRCLANQRAGNWREAIADAQGVLEFNATSITAWYRFGITLISAKMPAEAIDVLETALILDPKNADVKTKLKKARQALRTQAGKGMEEQEDAQLQSSVRESIDKAKTALKAHLADVQAGPFSSSASKGAAKAFTAEAMDFEMSAPMESVTQSETPSKRTPSQPDLQAHGESTVRTNAKDVPSGLSVPDSTILNGGRDEAISMQSESGSVEDQTPPEPTAQERAAQHKETGTEHYKQGEWQKAFEQYSAAIELDPEVAVYYGNRAAASIMLGKYKQALEDGQISVRLDPGYIRGYQRAGKALLTLGRTAEAISVYEEALRRGPSDKASKDGLAVVKDVAGNLTGGRKALEKGESRVALWHADLALRAASPAVEPAQLLKVQALSALNRHAEALAEGRSLSIEGNASHPDVLAIRAGALYSAGNMQLAERVYQEALRMDPDSTASRKGIKRLRSMNSAKEAGNQAFKQGRYTEAFDFYSSAIASDLNLQSSFIVQCLCNRSAAAYKLERHEEALADAEKAISLDPEYTKAYLRRATARSSLEDFEGAVRDYEKVKSLAPDTQDIGRLLQDAKTALKKSKRVDYYKLLGLPSTASQEDIKKAYKRTALKLHPDKVPEGEREEAEKQFKQLTAGHIILSDPQKRRKYDAGWTEEEIEQGGREMGGPGGFGGGFSQEDIYAELFAQMRGGGFGRQEYSF